MGTLLIRSIFCLQMIIFPSMSSTFYPPWRSFYDTENDDDDNIRIETCPEILENVDMIALHQIPIPLRKYLNASSSDTEIRFPSQKPNGPFFGDGAAKRTQGRMTHANQQQEIQCEYMVAWIRAYLENPCRCPSVEAIEEESIPEWLRFFITSQNKHLNLGSISPCDLQQWIMVFVESRQRDFHFKELALGLTNSGFTTRGSYSSSRGWTQTKGAYGHKPRNVNSGREFGFYTQPRRQYGAGMNRRIGAIYTPPSDSMAAKANQIQKAPFTSSEKNILLGSYSPPRKIIRKFYISNPPPPTPTTETAEFTSTDEYLDPLDFPVEPEPDHIIIEEEPVVKTTFIPQEGMDEEEGTIIKTTITKTFFEIPYSEGDDFSENWFVNTEEIPQLMEGNGEGGRLTIEGNGEGEGLTIDGNGELGRLTIDGNGEGGRLTIEGNGEGGRLTTEGNGEGERLTIEGNGESVNNGRQMWINKEVTEERPYSVIGNGEHMIIEQENVGLPYSNEGYGNIKEWVFRNISVPTVDHGIQNSNSYIINETADGNERKPKGKWVFVTKEVVPSSSNNDIAGIVNQTIELTPNVATEIQGNRELWTNQWTTVGDSNFKDGRSWITSNVVETIPISGSTVNSVWKYVHGNGSTGDSSNQFVNVDVSKPNSVTNYMKDGGTSEGMIVDNHGSTMNSIPNLFNSVVNSVKDFGGSNVSAGNSAVEEDKRIPNTGQSTGMLNLNDLDTGS